MHTQPADEASARWRWAGHTVATGWRSLEAWFARHAAELLFVALLTTIAAFLRIYRLGELPPGLHGDEALTGLDALRVLDEGWIGPYVGSALGQPTGPLYFTALVFKLSHPSLFTLRLSMAILGIATVPLAYLLFRVSFGRWVAVFGVIALTFAYWHVHFSRIAFMLISLPMMIAIVAAALVWATRSAHRWPWLIAGLALGAGVYTYGGFMLFLVVVAVFLCVQLALNRKEWRQQLQRYSLLVCGFVLIALPMIQYVAKSPAVYFSHSKQVSLFVDPQFTKAGGDSAKARVLAKRAWIAATLLFHHPGLDGVDATGGRGALDPVLAVLAYLGLAIALARWRSPPYLLAALTVMAGMGFIMFTSVYGGDMRRSLVAVPFVYGLAGVAAREIHLVAGRLLGSAGSRLAMAAVAASLVAAIAWNCWFYFVSFPTQNQMRWVFASDLVDSLEAVHRLKEPGTIYFYSSRWAYKYETRLFLYPQSRGIDRSKEFGKFSLERLGPGPVTYLFIAPYGQEMASLTSMYPGGTALIEYGTRGELRFALYHLP